MIANYHTHTYRCSHATGTEEEYILRSIENGIKILGFSEHVPFIFPDGYESWYRLQSSDIKNYFEVISALREKYKDSIEIHIGFEMEHYPLYFNDMLKHAKELGAEYLILGQHYIGNEYPNGKYTAEKDISEEQLIEYVSCVVEGMKTGEFLYVAHPDVCNYTLNDGFYKSQMRKICLASKEYNIPVELNLLGIFKKKHYPNVAFWEIAGEVGCPVVLGCDAHSPETAFSSQALIKAKAISEKYNLKVLDTLKI